MSGGRHRGGMGSTGRRGRQEGTGGVGQHSLCLRSACCVCVCMWVWVCMCGMLVPYMGGVFVHACGVFVHETC